MRSMPPASVDDPPSASSSTMTIDEVAMTMLRRKSGATRATATLVGMPTLNSHGPRSTTALP